MLNSTPNLDSCKCCCCAGSGARPSPSGPARMCGVCRLAGHCINPKPQILTTSRCDTAAGSGARPSPFGPARMARRSASSAASRSWRKSQGARCVTCYVMLHVILSLVTSEETPLCWATAMLQQVDDLHRHFYDKSAIQKTT